VACSLYDLSMRRNVDQVVFGIQILELHYFYLVKLKFFILTFNNSFLYIRFMINCVVLPPVIFIFGFIKLKMLLRHRQRMAAEEDPPSEFYDINRDEKNVIFQLLIMVVVILIVTIFGRIVIENFLRKYGMQSSEYEYVKFAESLSYWPSIICLFFKDLLLISYIDKRLNFKFLF
jgi:hypothetical protein